MATFRAFNPDAQRKQFGQGSLFFTGAVPRDRVFRPQAGNTYKNRILPPWSDRAVICLRIPTYYQCGMQQMSFISPQHFEVGSCPFFNYYQDLLKQYKDLKDNDNFKWDYAQVRPRSYWVYNIIVDAEKSKGPQLWMAGYEANLQIEALLDNPEYGYIADPDNGYNLTLTVTKHGQKTNTMITASRTPSRLEDFGWADQLFDIDLALQRPNVADVQACFDTIPWRFAKPANSPTSHGVRTAPVLADSAADDIPTSWPAHVPTEAHPTPVRGQMPPTPDAKARYEETMRLRDELKAQLQQAKSPQE